jgi:hypothetical protein
MVTRASPYPEATRWGAARPLLAALPLPAATGADAVASALPVQPHELPREQVRRPLTWIRASVLFRQCEREMHVVETLERGQAKACVQSRIITKA